MRGALERLDDQITELSRKRGLLAQQAEPAQEVLLDPVGPQAE